MTPDRDRRDATTEPGPRRRELLTAIGGLAVLGTAGAGSALAMWAPSEADGVPPEPAGGPPDGDGGRPANDLPSRTIQWRGQGSEHEQQDCPEAIGTWHWVLTPGGRPPFETVGELVVTFEGGLTRSVQGSQAGGGAYHFDVRKAGGGTVEAAAVEVTGGGDNALLTISDGACAEGTVRYWQVDVAEGEVREPPAYWPDDVMAALGNSIDGVTDNPSLRRQGTDGQLGDVDIDGAAFTFDDETEPATVTVDVEIAPEGDERDLHLAAWILPGPFDPDEVEAQTLHDSTVESFDGGEAGTLTVDVPPVPST